LPFDHPVHYFQRDATSKMTFIGLPPRAIFMLPASHASRRMGSRQELGCTPSSSMRLADRTACDPLSLSRASRNSNHIICVCVWLESEAYWRARDVLSRWARARWHQHNELTAGAKRAPLRLVVPISYGIPATTNSELVPCLKPRYVAPDSAKVGVVLWCDMPRATCWCAEVSARLSAMQIEVESKKQVWSGLRRQMDASGKHSMQLGGWVRATHTIGL
jgi:hypothetical protein